MHPKYNGGNFDFDFSLLELGDALKFNDQIQSITLPNEDLLVYAGTMCEIAGWGKKHKYHYIK